MKRVLSLLFCSIISGQAFSQNVAINNDGSQPNASAMLDIKNANKGLLIPRVNLVSETDVATISSPVTSLLVFNTNAALPDGVGFYFWNGNNKWSKLATVNASNNTSWGLVGNNNTNPATNFIGTTDDQPLIFKTNNFLSGKIDHSNYSVFFGQRAGESITTAIDNTFIGDAAGIKNTSGSGNLFAGRLAGFTNISGDNNVFLGKEAGKLNTTGYDNVFLGKEAGKSNTTGFGNMAIGSGALYSNTSGYRNFATGYGGALYSNTTGSGNIANGYLALASNTTGNYNLGMGYQALYANITGSDNIGIGANVLLANTVGDYNIAMGSFAMIGNTTGSYNTAVGISAGPVATYTNLQNTTCIGYDAGVRINNAMAFGNTSVEKWLFGIDVIFVNRALQVGSTAINGNGAFLTNGGTWTNASSRIKKDDFSELNSNDLLQKISQLAIQKWKYKGTDEYHIGPVAEDFYEAFGLGTDDKGISTVDPAGIALAAIQELIRVNETLQKRIEALEKK